MLHRAHALSSTTEAFNEECAKLRSIFSRLDYPIGLVNSTINMFILSKPDKKIDDGNTIRIVLPFKDQIAANAVRRQLRDLSRKICVTLQPIFVSKKLEQDLNPIQTGGGLFEPPLRQNRDNFYTKRAMTFKFSDFS